MFIGDCHALKVLLEIGTQPQTEKLRLKWRKEGRERQRQEEGKEYSL